MKTWHTDSCGWTEQEWKRDCLLNRGEILSGRFRHYCNDWDDLPIDETCPEFSACTCWGTRRDVGER